MPSDNPSVDTPKLIAAASAFVGLGEDGADNHGPMVELFLREVHQLPGQPWCAAFVYHVGFWSQYDHAARRSRWPLPATASCWELGEFARVRGVLRQEPSPGDVFLLYSQKLRRFAHTGIVVSVDSCSARQGGVAGYTCTTVEGNTNDDGAREGRMTLFRNRSFVPARGDRFVRWTQVAREKAA